MPIATNAQGQALRLDATGQWVPTQLASNPQTGAKLALDGDKWVPLGETTQTFGQALGKAVPAALNQVGDAAGAVATGIGHVAKGLVNDPLGYLPLKAAQVITSVPGAVARDAGGMAQYVRNLSAPEFRGSAPTMPGGEAANHPYLALTQGDTAPLKQEIATKPLNILADAAALAGTTAPGRMLLGKGADLAMAGPRKLARALEDMTPANRAENALTQAAGQTSDPSTIAALLETRKSPVAGVPLTAAQITQDPGIYAAEKGSRLTQGPAWAQFDTGQNTAMFNALHGIVNPADDVAVKAAMDARTAATQYQRKAALALADQGSLEPLAGFQAGDTLASQGLQPHDLPEQFSGPIRDAAASELAIGPRRVNPAVKKTGNFVLDSIPGEGATASDAYEVRKILTDALNARTGQQLDEIPAAAKSAGETTRTIKNTIDASLNDASGGEWQKYLSGFAANSKDVNSVQALNNIRADLAKKIEGGAVDGNGNPKLTRAYIAQTIQKHATNKYGDLIAPGVKSRLDAIVDTAQQIEAPGANYRAAATGGSGSDTASNLALLAGQHLARALGPAGRIATTIAHGVAGLGENAGAVRLGQLLQNQADAAAAIRSAQARVAARNAAKSTGTMPAALAALLAAQQQ